MEETLDEILDFIKIRLNELAESCESEAAKAGLWDKIFWAFRIKGLIWKVAEQCSQGINAIGNSDLISVKQSAWSMLNDLEVFSGIRESKARLMFPYQFKRIQEILSKV